MRRPFRTNATAFALIFGAALALNAGETAGFVVATAKNSASPAQSARQHAAPTLFAKKKKKGGAKKKGGGGDRKRSGFEWASSFTLKPFEAQALRDLASSALASFEGRSGRPLCDELKGVADLPKALWNAPVACIVVGPPSPGEEPGTEEDGSDEEEVSKPSVVVKYANVAALETVGLKAGEFEKLIAPVPVPGGESKAPDVTVMVDLPATMSGKFEGGYKKKILRVTDGGSSDDITILDAKRWAIEKSALIDGKFVTESIGVAYAWSEWALGEDTLCSPGGKRKATVRTEDLGEAVQAQAAAIRKLKEEHGLGNKDPEVVEAVEEHLRLKALLAAAD